MRWVGPFVGGFASVTLLLVLAGAVQAWTGADGPPAQYSGADTPGGGPTNQFSTITAMTGWTCGDAAGDDSFSANIFPATFNFPFYGATQTTAFAGTNGYLSFGSGYSSFSTWSYTALPQAFAPHNVIYGNMNDLYVPFGDPSSTICHLSTGSGTNEVFYAWWKNVNHLSGSGAINFVIVLYEATGLIEVHYGTSMSDGFGDPEVAGIEDASSSVGLGYNLATVSPTNVAVQYRPVAMAPTATADTYTLDCLYSLPCAPLVVNGAAGTATHKLLLSGPAGVPAADTGITTVPLKASLVSAPTPAGATLETLNAGGACSGTAWATGFPASTDGRFCFKAPATMTPCGTYTFTYRADDAFNNGSGTTPTDVATVTVTVINCAIPPIAVADPCVACAGGATAYEAIYSHTLTVLPASGLLVNDYDPTLVPISNLGLAIDCTPPLCTMPAGDGTVTVLPSGGFTYVPPSTGVCRNVAFSYRVLNVLTVPSTPVTVTIHVCPDLPPVITTASGSPNPHEVGQVASFVGLASDPESDPFTTYWVFGDGFTSNVAAPTHTYSKPGVYNVEFHAVDPIGGESVASFAMVVTYKPEPDADDAVGTVFSAFAGVDQTVAHGDRVTLHGSAPGASLAELAWRQIAGPRVELSDLTAAEPSFIASGRNGDLLIFELVASLDGTDSAPDQVAITIAATDHAPVAVTHAIDALPGSKVTLDASASYDLDGDTLTATWRQREGPTMTLNQVGPLRASGIVPFTAEGKTLVFSMQLSDGTHSVERTVIVRVAEGLGRGEAILTEMTDGGRLHAYSRLGGESFEWDFGDQSTGSGYDVTHDYAQAGHYIVTMRILMTNGETRVYATEVVAEKAYLAADVPGTTAKSSPGPAPIVALIGLLAAIAVMRRRGEA